MGIQFFEEPITTGGDVPFAKEFLDEYPRENGKQYRVTEVLLVKSNKGYIVKTDRFITFLWKRSNTAKMLVEALEVYVRDCYGYSVIAVLDNKLKDCVRLGIDPDSPCQWYGSGKKFTITEVIPTLDVLTVNPFLIPHVPSPPITPPAGNNGKAKALSPEKLGKAT